MHTRIIKNNEAREFISRSNKLSTSVSGCNPTAWLKATLESWKFYCLWRFITIYIQKEESKKWGSQSPNVNVTFFFCLIIYVIKLYGWLQSQQLKPLYKAEHSYCLLILKGLTWIVWNQDLWRNLVRFMNEFMNL